MGGTPDRPAPDLDQVIDAFVRLMETATYTDAVRKADELAIRSAGFHRPAGADDLRDRAGEAESHAHTALYELLDHERVMRLIPRVGEARWRSSRRAEDDYAALADESADEDGAGS